MSDVSRIGIYRVYDKEARAGLANKLTQVTTMPTSPSDGQVALYMGVDTDDYKAGTIYQYDATESKWVAKSAAGSIDVDSELSPTSENPVQNKVLTAALSLLDETKVEQVSELPSPTADNEGFIRLLIADQAGYEKGMIYQCQPNADSTDYEWVAISSSTLVAGKGITIGSDNSINADTNIFYGELDEFNALDADEKAKYSHISTPESEDALVPSAKVTQLSDGARIDITDQNGTTTATVRNVAGELIPSVSKYQTGTQNLTQSVDAWKSSVITLSEAMPDSDYCVDLSVTGSNLLGIVQLPVVIAKTASTFTVGWINDTSKVGASDVLRIDYKAFKLMTDAALLADEAQIKQNKADIATLKSEVVVKSAYTTESSKTLSATLNNVQGTSWSPIYVFYDKNICFIWIGANTDTLTIHNVVNNTGVELSSTTLTKVSGNTYTLSLTFSSVMYKRCFIHYR